jgi:uncharacterized protein with HEPN domain
MSPRDLVSVGHIDMARKAVSKTPGISREAFDADENLRLALIHLIQIIGEAGRQVSQDFCASHPEIRGAEITGMRHKVVHDYLGVDEDHVCQVVTEDLPSFDSSCVASLACETRRRAVSAACSAERVDGSETSSATGAGILSGGISATLEGFAMSDATEGASLSNPPAGELLERVADAVRILSSSGDAEGKPALSHR